MLAPLGGHGHQGIEVEGDPADRHGLQQVDGGHRLLLLEQLAQGFYQKRATSLQLGGQVRGGLGRWGLVALGSRSWKGGQRPWRPGGPYGGPGLPERRPTSAADHFAHGAQHLLAGPALDQLPAQGAVLHQGRPQQAQ